MVDVAQLVAEVKTKGVRKATDELDRFGKEAGQADKSTAKFKKGATAAFGAVKVGAVALTGATAALTALTVKVAAAQKEWQTLSNIAGDSVDNFKATAFAAEQVGISAEKLADISKDTNEKLGEFIATGGGGFKDFFEQVAPQVNLTAKELQGLSGPQVLGRVKSALDAANVPLEQQSFYLESIASDTTNLIPLLANEGAELNRLTGEYNKLNDALALSASQKSGVGQISESFNLLGKTASNALDFIVGSFAPEFDSAISGASQVITDLAQSFVFFFKSFQEGTEENLLIKLKDNLEDIAEEQENVYSSKNLEKARDNRVIKLEKENAKILEQLQLVRKLESEENKRAQASAFNAVNIKAGGSTFTPSASEADTTRAAEKAKREAERKKEEEERIARETKAREEEIFAYRIQLAQDFNNEQDRLNLEYLNGIDARREAEIQNQQMIFSATSGLFSNLAELQQTYGKDQGKTYKALFAASKAFAIAESVIAIQQGIAKSASLGFPANIPAIASTVAATSGLVSNISSVTYDSGNFANGGVIGGGSFAGDNITANVNSGEMILNRGQQKNLFDIANGGGGGGANVTVINNAPNSTARAETMSDGRVKVIVEEVLNSEVLSPNSSFNKNLDRTRKVQRQL